MKGFTKSHNEALAY